METFKLGHGAGTDWQETVDHCLSQIGKTGLSHLAFIYVTDGFAKDLGNILRYLKQHTSIQHWIGSIGQAICCTNTEYYDQPAMAIQVCTFPEHSYTVFNHEKDAQHLQSHRDIAGLRFAIVHADPRNGQIPALIDRLPEQLGNGYLVGGLTSSNNQYFQIADEIVEGQLSGIVFNEKIQVLTGLSQGCIPISKTHTLTECDGHMAITIDGRPALDVFKENIGEVLARNIDRAAGYIFAGFPVKGSDTGDYLVRNIIGLDPKHGMLAIGEHLQAGAPIMFCRRDGKSAIEDMQRMLNDMKQRLTTPPKGGIYISCLGRGRYLFGDDSREMKMISDIFGDIPLVGFYANGEIAGQRLYGYTGVLTLFI